MTQFRKTFNYDQKQRMSVVMNKGFTNPGLLIIGGGNDSLDEAYITLWAISKSPLILAGDIGKYTSQSTGALKQNVIINIHKNLKTPVYCAKYCKDSDPVSIYIAEYKPKKGDAYNAPNDRLVAIVNWSNKVQKVSNLMLSEGGIWD